MSLFWCLHLLISSDLLFNKLSSLYLASSSFSLKHRQYFLLVVLKDAHFLIIQQMTFAVKWLCFIVQYFLDSFVSFSWCSRLNDFVWLLNMCLKFASTVPIKCFVYSWDGSTWLVLCKRCLGLNIFHLEGSCFCNCTFSQSQWYLLVLFCHIIFIKTFFHNWNQ